MVPTGEVAAIALIERPWAEPLVASVARSVNYGFPRRPARLSACRWSPPSSRCTEACT